MTDYPSENTLTVNVTHRQLRSLNPLFSDLVAIAPTRVEEGKHRRKSSNPEGGYDISLETAKEVVFQHKRPYGITEHQGTDWLKFNVDTDQCWALAEQYELGQAFLALPVVPTARELPHCLGLTVFIDVHLIDHYNNQNWMPKDGNSISAVYVEQSDKLVHELKRVSDPVHLDSSLAPAVHLKSNSNKWKMGGPAYQEISMRDFQSPAIDSAIAWSPIAEKLRSCRYGVRIRGGEERYQTTPVSGAFQRFLPEVISDGPAPAYRNRVARTRALAALSGEISTDANREELTDAITEDILARRRARDDFFRLEVDAEAVSARVSQAVERFWQNPERFQQVAGQTRRVIFEGGRESEPLVIE